eukprot:gb/GECG01003598.1/.p1 GENE.gb/GECG01003598.1/~~gb/GECG01003598.1/.p1  ORF type:complete len:570 (+),score=91.60 gb/GECG01003598.1/:1-1710(+)
MASRGKTSTRRRRNVEDEDDDVKDEPRDEDAAKMGTTHTSAPPQSLSERRRQAVQAKQELMESLGLQDNKRALESKAQELKAQERRSREARKREKKKDFSSGPKRRSLRQQGMTPEGYELPPNYNDNRPSFFTPGGGEIEEEEDVDGDMLGDNAVDDEIDEELRNKLEELQTCPVNPNTPGKIHWPAIDIKEDHHVIKAAKDRVYSLMFHPRTDRKLVVSGQKWGGVAFWFPDVEEAEESVILWRPHRRPVASVMCPSSNPSQLYTSSYDGKVRRFDAGAQVWQEILPYESQLTYCDVTSDNRHLFATNKDGELISIDLRTITSPQKAVDKLKTPPQEEQEETPSKKRRKKAPEVVGKSEVKEEKSEGHEEERGNYSSAEEAKTSTFGLHSKKSGSVSVDPKGSYVLTAGHDQTAKLWDIRMVLPSSNKKKVEPFATLNHTGGVTSAFYSPSGNKCVSTCNDDRIRIFDMDAIKKGSYVDASVSIRHNNHTGRWLSNFRTIWDPHGDDIVVVGAMGSRAVEAYYAGNGKRLAARTNPDRLTAVPTLNAVHPTLPLVASATASGRLHLWT